MKKFQPETVIFRKDALEYPLGNKLYDDFNNNKDIEVHTVKKRGRFPFDYDLSFRKKFHRSKQTIIVSVRSLSKFQSCRPSADYQLPLVSGCPGHCHYCYLSTNLGKNPYIRIYVNLAEIYDKAIEYIEDKKPELTVFEGAATSDPLPVERWSGSLAETIKFFAGQKYASFRFVTKFSDIDSLLNIEHNGRTEFRFSLNSNYPVNKFEKGTPTIKERIAAARKVADAGYKTGFLIAPIFVYDNWKEEYQSLLRDISKNFPDDGTGLSFELISHRFTERAKKVILKAYPGTELPMNEKARKFKYGQFGYGKYVYPKETLQQMEDFFKEEIKQILPGSKIKYFV